MTTPNVYLQLKWRTKDFLCFKLTLKILLIIKINKCKNASWKTDCDIEISEKFTNANIAENEKKKQREGTENKFQNVDEWEPYIDSCAYFSWIKQ